MRITAQLRLERRPLGSIWSKPSAQAAPMTEGCAGPHPGGFWRFPRRDSQAVPQTGSWLPRGAIWLLAVLDTVNFCALFPRRWLSSLQPPLLAVQRQLLAHAVPAGPGCVLSQLSACSSSSHYHHSSQSPPGGAGAGYRQESAAECKEGLGRGTATPRAYHPTPLCAGALTGLQATDRHQCILQELCTDQ